jgi:hypothetical protein
MQVEGTAEAVTGLLREVRTMTEEEPGDDEFEGAKQLRLRSIQARFDRRTGIHRISDLYRFKPTGHRPLILLMNTCALKVGRLLEIRAAAGYRTVDDVDALFNSVKALVAKLPPTQRLVAVTDWRFCPIMSGEAAERALARITATNPRTERSGAVASRDSPTAVLQFLRLVRASRHPDRRLFYELTELVAWLGEVLNPVEIARLKKFLSEPIERSATG